MNVGTFIRKDPADSHCWLPKYENEAYIHEIEKYPSPKGSQFPSQTATHQLDLCKQRHERLSDPMDILVLEPIARSPGNHEELLLVLSARSRDIHALGATWLCLIVPLRLQFRNNLRPFGIHYPKPIPLCLCDSASAFRLIPLHSKDIRSLSQIRVANWFSLAAFAQVCALQSIWCNRAYSRTYIWPASAAILQISSIDKPCIRLQSRSHYLQPIPKWVTDQALRLLNKLLSSTMSIHGLAAILERANGHLSRHLWKSTLSLLRATLALLTVSTAWL